MTLDEFQALVDSWGADLERWPEALRPDARRLAREPACAALLRQAAELDALLARRPAVTPDRAARAADAVLTRLASESIRRPAPPSMRRSGWLLPGWPLPGWVLPGAGLACSALAGILLAGLLPLNAAGTPGPDAVLALILDSGSMAAGLVLR